MSTESAPEPLAPAQTQASLKQLAAALRSADHLEPETQKALASLLDELGTEFGATGLTSPNAVHLAETVNDVARSLHERRLPQVSPTARNRLKDAAARAEVEAPVASGVVYRLIDLLQSLGI
jgi:hypothetical protein